MVPPSAARHNRSVRHDPRLLHGTACDLLVVGAGLAAAAIARDAALRGLSVVLAAAGDVVGGAALAPASLWLAGSPPFGADEAVPHRELVGERERLLRHAPHLVRPLPVLLPFHQDGGPGPWRTRMDLALRARTGGRSTLPPPRALTAPDAAAAFPGLRTAGLRSAVVFFAGLAHDARLALANALDAAAAGARVVSHCRVGGVSERGILLVDIPTGAEVVLRARHVAHVAGADGDEVRRRLGVGNGPFAAAIRRRHLVLAPRAGELALVARLPDGRSPFVAPLTDGTLCGFVGADVPDPASGCGELLAALGSVLDPAPGAGDVRWSFATPCAAAAARRQPPGGDERLPGAVLHSAVGGDPATHRSTAERAVARWFGLPAASPTRVRALPGGDGPREVTDPLWWRHGGRAGLVRAIAAAEPTAALPLCPHRPFLVAEAIAALRHDGAATFADLLLRRLVHDVGPCLEPGCLRAAHALFLRERRWPVDDDPAVAIAALRAELAAAGAATGSSPAVRP